MCLTNAKLSDIINKLICGDAGIGRQASLVGGFEAAEDTTNSVKLSNVQWKGTADANGVAELRILTIQNA